jgi:hypothetical protein
MISLIRRLNIWITELQVVIPATAGIQEFYAFIDSRFRGSDEFVTFSEFVIFKEQKNDSSII